MSTIRPAGSIATHHPLAGFGLPGIVRGAALVMVSLAWLPLGCDRGGAPAGTAESNGSAATAAASGQAAPVGNQAEDRADTRDVTPAAESADRRPIPVQGMPPIRLEPSVLDFGFVAPSSASTGVVKLVNPTETPLKILAVQPSCKCTTISDLEGKTIPAGGSLDLEATLDAAAAPGPKKAQIRVLVDGYTQVVVVELKAEVALAVRVTPPYINAVEGKNQSGRLVVQSTDGKPFRICSTHGMPPRFIGFDPARDEPRAQYLVEYDVADLGERIPRYWVVETDRADAPLVDVLLRHERSFPNFNLRMKDYRISAGVVPAGGSGEFKIRLENRTDPVTTAISRSPAGKVEFVSESVGDEETEVTLRITPAAGTEGFLYLPFTIFTRAGQGQDLDVFATVTSVPGGSCATTSAAGTAGG
ncbi:MAG: DUF1573 domain-containing protein [Phycisphaerales bacterium]